tara:strand:- start:1898 stop:2119 length:222 start_codon:yes stop_codon:yes gene_type:complete
MQFDQMKSKQGDLNPVDGNNLYREGLDPMLIGREYQGPLQQDAPNAGSIHQNNMDFSNMKTTQGELSSAQEAK